MRGLMIFAAILAISVGVGFLSIAGCSNPAPQDEASLARWADTAFYDLSADALDGAPADFEAWRGRPVLVVNVASRCGMTPQYEGLQALHEEYGVSVPLMAKVEVKTGEDPSPVYEFLGARTGDRPSWNFAKYLVSKDGQTVRYFGPRTQPDDEDLRAAITVALQ